MVLIHSLSLNKTLATSHSSLSYSSPQLSSSLSHSSLSVKTTQAYSSSSLSFFSLCQNNPLPFIVSSDDDGNGGSVSVRLATKNVDVVSGEDGGVDLTDWVRLRVADGRGPDCLDAALVPEIGIQAAEKGMKEVLGITLRCIRSVSERPGIKTIYEDLSSI